MANPIAILDRRAREMFEAHVAKQKGRWTLSAFTWGDKPNPTWDECPNHEREKWRTKALADLRSEDSVLDELKREDRERRRTLTLQRDGDPA